MTIPLNLHPDRLFPVRSGHARTRAQTLRARSRPADRQPARPYRPAVVRRRRAVRRCVGAAAHAGPLRASACSTARASRWRRSAIPRRGDARPGPAKPTRARSGARSPRTTICSAARRRACGSTRCSPSVFGIDERLTPRTADRYLRPHHRALQTPAFRPRALFERFNIEVHRDDRVAARSARASPDDPRSGWRGRVVTAYRPDPVVDPEFEGFPDNCRASAR